MKHCFYVSWIFAVLAVLGIAEARNLPTHGVLIVGGMNEKVLNGAASNDDIYNDIEVFPTSCRSPVPDLPILNAVTGSYKGQVISCGGTNMTSPEDGTLSLDCFKLSEENTWQKIAPLNVARTQFYSVLVEVGDYLVAIFTPYDGLTTMEVFDGKSWTLRPDLELGLDSFPETVDLTTGDFVARENWGLSYVTSNLILTLHIPTGTWERQDISTSNNDDETVLGARVQPMNNGLLRTGGTNLEKSSNSTTFMSLATGSNDWEMYSSLNFARFGHSLAVIDGTPTVFGGAAYSMGKVMPALTSTERFVGGKWVEGEQMQKGRLGQRVIVIPCEEAENE